MQEGESTTEHLPAGLQLQKRISAEPFHTQRTECHRAGMVQTDAAAPRLHYTCLQEASALYKGPQMNESALNARPREHEEEQNRLFPRCLMPGSSASAFPLPNPAALTLRLGRTHGTEAWHVHQ